MMAVRLSLIRCYRTHLMIYALFGTIIFKKLLYPDGYDDDDDAIVESKEVSGGA